MSDIGILKVILGGDTSGLDSAMKTGLGSVLKFQKGVEAAGAELFNLRNAFIAVAGAAVVDFAKKGANAGDEIAKTAQKIDITTDSLQELRYAALQGGVTTEDFDAALLQLNKRLGEVNGGVTESAVALGKLGLTMADVKGKKADEVFKLIADRLPLVADGMERSRLETDLFGKAGQQLASVLAGGSAGLAQMAIDAHNLGFVLSAETIKKATEANDEFTRIGEALKIAGINIAVGFLPALESLKKTVTSQDFQDGVKTLGANFASLIGYLVDHKTEIAEVVATFAGFRLGAAAGAVFGPQAAALSGIIGGIVGLAVAARETRPEIEKLDSSITAWTEARNVLQKQLDTTKDDDQIKKLADQMADYEKKIAEATARRAQLVEISNAQPAAAHITVTPEIPLVPIDPNITKSIEDLHLKARILQQDFIALAPGFTEAAMGMQTFGMMGAKTKTTIEELTPQQRDFNQALLDFKAAQLTQENLAPWQLYAQQIAQLDVLQQSANLSANAYASALLKIRFPSLAQGIRDASDLNKNLDTFATSTVNNFASGFAQVVTGQKKASEAFQAFGVQVLTMITEMIIKMLILKAIELAIGFAGGGDVATGGQNAGAGLSASAENPSMFATGGPIGFGGAVAGPGTNTSDSILARLSNGEYVVNAMAANRHRGLLDAINFGGLPALADGGMVGIVPQLSIPDAAVMGPGGMSGVGGDTTVEMHFHGQTMFDRGTLEMVARGFESLSRDGRPLKIKIVS